MRKLANIIPCLFSVLLFTVSCHHEYDEMYDEDYYYHHPDAHHPLDHHDYYNEHDKHYHDNSVYNYIRGGRWYYVSTYGELHTHYDSYIVFNDWEILHYDRDHHMYDKGTYDYADGRIHIHYDNGDVVDYWINKACDNELILRSRSGVEYRYVRR